ncbi:MAG: helix-turn-helix transcriptional regulator [Rhizobiaceae bacterium]|nr:helix-turn-helix transcriptional regulator [Rhizobiaceae bacterium]
MQNRPRLRSISTSGALKFFQPKDQNSFDALKGDVFNHGKYGARPRKEAISTSDDTFLCIELALLNNSDDIGSADFRGFILYSTDTNLAVHCNKLPIKFAYGLTDTELSLVDAIGEGLTNAQIAERRDRSVATINAQVKSILSKSHCSTRTQFVRLMMSFGANYVASGQ